MKSRQINYYFVCGKNLRPFGVHSMAEMKNFAWFYCNSINLFDVGQMFLPVCHISPIRSKAMATELPARFLLYWHCQWNRPNDKQQYIVHYCFSKDTIGLQVYKYWLFSIHASFYDGDAKTSTPNWKGIAQFHFPWTFDPDTLRYSLCIAISKKLEISIDRSVLVFEVPIKLDLYNLVQNTCDSIINCFICMLMSPLCLNFAWKLFAYMYVCW